MNPTTNHNSLLANNFQSESVLIWLLHVVNVILLLQMNPEKILGNGLLKLSTFTRLTWMILMFCQQMFVV